MNKARVLVNGIFAGILEKLDEDKYSFTYAESYQGPPVSLTMPTRNKMYAYEKFPPFFEGLLPEGEMLEALLRKYKLDKKDYFRQLLIVGQDVVGAVTIEEFK
jgi:serine/threonine-protein kinase HipA